MLGTTILIQLAAAGRIMRGAAMAVDEVKRSLRAVGAAHVLLEGNTG